MHPRPNENFYRDLVHKISDAIIQFNIAGEIQYANPQCNDLIGLTPENLVGSNFFEYVHEEDLDTVVNTVNVAYKSSAIITSEFRIKNTHGNFIYVSVRGSAQDFDNIKPLDPNKILVTAVIRDITEKKEFYNKLRESEKKYRDLFEKSPLGILLTTVDGEIIDCNPKTIFLTGFEKEEILGKRIEQLTPHPAFYRAFFRKAYDDLVKNKKTFSFDVPVFKKSGERMMVNVSESILTIGKEKLLMVLAQDITAKKKLEKRLENSEHRYRHLFESSPLPITLFDKDGIIVDANKATKKVTGYSKSDLAGKRFTSMTIFDKDAQAKILETIPRLYNGKEPGPLVVKGRHKSGLEMWLELEGTPVEIDDETFIQVIGQDITEMKKARDILKEENVRLRKVDEMRKTFISNATHEIKTPLISLYSTIDYLLSCHKEELTVNTLELLTMAKRGAVRLKKLIDRLLDMSKLEAGKLEILLQDHDLVEVVKECIESIQYLLTDRDHEIAVDLPDKIVLKMDKQRIERVILNLLSNSIKYTPNGGKILIKVDQKNHSARFSLFDTGVGFTKEELPEVFKKFGKFERNARDVVNEGTGLGLFLTHEIIKMHGGNITVESDGRNKGSKFTFTLPLNG